MKKICLIIALFIMSVLSFSQSIEALENKMKKLEQTSIIKYYSKYERIGTIKLYTKRNTWQKVIFEKVALNQYTLEKYLKLVTENYREFSENIRLKQYPEVKKNVSVDKMIGGWTLKNREGLSVETWFYLDKYGRKQCYLEVEQAEK